MNFLQMHERLRLELLRRIQRGTLSVSLLSRQTGFGQSHLSNFLNAQRLLSLKGLDRILAALQITTADLLPSRASPALSIDEDPLHVPLVSHHTAMFEPRPRPGTIQTFVHVPAGLLGRTRARSYPARQKWVRFVVIQAGMADADAMEPVVSPEALLLLDRHYTVLQAYRPDRPSLFAVRHDAHLKIRYADVQDGRLLLRPYRRTAPVELIAPGPGESPRDLITGRIVLVMNET